MASYRLLSRRHILLGAMFAAAGPAAAQPVTDAAAQDLLAGLEHRYGGRLGVAVLNVGTGRRIGHRAGELFAMCSTFKFLAATFVLARVDRGQERLDRRIVVGKQDLLPHAPISVAHVGGAGLTVAQLCEAVITVSDNTAANLLLASFGGPAALTHYARSLGDRETRLDRIEMALNDVGPGDPRDSTTPNAMLENLRRIVLGRALSSASRTLLTAWMVANQTGDARLRAGLPKSWRVADKTGTGPEINNAVNDIAVAWPPGRAPMIVTSYYSDSAAPEQQREFVLSQVGQVACRV